MEYPSVEQYSIMNVMPTSYQEMKFVLAVWTVTNLLICVMDLLVWDNFHFPSNPDLHWWDVNNHSDNAQLADPFEISDTAVSL